MKLFLLRPKHFDENISDICACHTNEYDAQIHYYFAETVQNTEPQEVSSHYSHSVDSTDAV